MHDFVEKTYAELGKQLYELKTPLKTPLRGIAHQIRSDYIVGVGQKKSIY
jgi:hypothetical protein